VSLNVLSVSSEEDEFEITIPVSSGLKEKTLLLLIRISAARNPSLLKLSILKNLE
jgi:hypothetical protein